MPTIIPFDDNLFLKKCGENFQSPPSPLPPSSQMKWRGPFFCLHCRGHCRGHAETARVRNPSTFRHLLLRVICCPGRPIHHYSLCTLLCLSSPTSVHAWPECMDHPSVVASSAMHCQGRYTWSHFTGVSPHCKPGLTVRACRFSTWERERGGRDDILVSFVELTLAPAREANWKCNGSLSRPKN
jgi:hypothetical protein